jgi:hypothetical protein
VPNYSIFTISKQQQQPNMESHQHTPNTTYPKTNTPTPTTTNVGNNMPELDKKSAAIAKQSAAKVNRAAKAAAKCASGKEFNKMQCLQAEETSRKESRTQYSLTTPARGGRSAYSQILDRF